MTEVGGLRRNGGWRGDAVFRGSSVSKPIIHAVNFVTDGQPTHALPDGGNDAGELMSQDGTAAVIALFRVRSGVPQQFRRRDAGGMHLNQQFTGTGPRCSNVLFD